MTGWNLPPGCSVRDLPGEQDYPCEICGLYDEDCICPECPVCEEFGDPLCYEYHGLVRTQAQIDSLAEYNRDQELYAAKERKFWDELFSKYEN